MKKSVMRADEKTAAFLLLTTEAMIDKYVRSGLDKKARDEMQEMNRSGLISDKAWKQFVKTCAGWHRSYYGNLIYDAAGKLRGSRSISGEWHRVID